MEAGIFDLAAQNLTLGKARDKTWKQRSRKKKERNKHEN